MTRVDALQKYLQTMGALAQAVGLDIDSVVEVCTGKWTDGELLSVIDGELTQLREAAGVGPHPGEGS